MLLVQLADLGAEDASSGRFSGGPSVSEGSTGCIGNSVGCERPNVFGWCVGLGWSVGFGWSVRFGWSVGLVCRFRLVRGFWLVGGFWGGSSAVVIGAGCIAFSLLSTAVDVFRVCSFGDVAVIRAAPAAAAAVGDGGGGGGVFVVVVVVVVVVTVNVAAVAVTAAVVVATAALLHR